MIIPLALKKEKDVYLFRPYDFRLDTQNGTIPRDGGFHRLPSRKGRKKRGGRLYRGGASRVNNFVRK